MEYEFITTDEQLAEFCRQVADAGTIALDTEFISEHTYRPQLCLIQVAAAERLAVIDPLAVGDVTPFWNLVVAEGHETIVHAGREEFNFCLRATGKRPAALLDLQIAAGLVGTEYPAGYGSLLQRYLGVKLHKHETRTDWSKRPLAKRQIEYALDDVRYLEPLGERIVARIDRLGRRAWLADEMAAWQNDVQAAGSGERWRRTSGISGLAPRSLAVVRELWLWREREAERRDLPVRRVLRDDLIVELARRQATDPRQISVVRGLERGDLKRSLPELAECVRRAMQLRDDECPRLERRDVPSQLNLVAQLLTSILSSICRAAEVSVGIVGSVQDVRELVAYRLGIECRRDDGPPLLATGWRAGVVGQIIDDMLAGRTHIRIADPLSDEPFVFEPHRQ